MKYYYFLKYKLFFQVKAVNEYGENVTFSRLNVTPASPTRKIPPITPPKPSTPLLFSPTFGSNAQAQIRERPAIIDMALVNQSLTEGQCAIFQVHF